MSDSPAVALAAKFLKKELANGPVTRRALLLRLQGHSKGFSVSSLKRAQYQLGVKITKVLDDESRLVSLWELPKETKGDKPMKMSAVAINESPSYDLSHLAPTVRVAVQKLIDDGRAVKCSSCSELFVRDKESRNYCKACKAAGRHIKREAKEPTPRVCKNPRCGKQFSAVGNKKYCSEECRSIYWNVCYKRKKKEEAPVPQPQPTQPHEGTVRRRSDHVSYEGAPCHIPGCAGTMTLKHGAHGLFYGCQYFHDELRPAGVPKCRATAVYASNVDGRTLDQPEQPKPKPEAPTPRPIHTVRPTPSPQVDIAERILHELQVLNGEVRDCIGRVDGMERMVKHSNESVAAMRKELTEIEWKLSELHSELSQ